MELSAIDVQGVVKRFGPSAALGPLTLSVRERSTLALIGPSGSGKSTLLRLVMGLVEPDEGVISVRGRVVRRSDAALRRKMGYVLQGGGLFPHLRAAENVTLVARTLRLPAERIALRLSELASLCRLAEAVLGRYPAELSGGQRQRVSLMRALMLDPEVLLLDEPLGALDPVTRSELQVDLRRIFDELGKTVLLVTHDLGEAAFFAHRVALLLDGRVVQEGTLAELESAPSSPFVSRFVQAHREGGANGVKR
ncbi:MAG TPA: ATP-binding cassette domain-containing protein [Anaeromyxobacteraceae bacterium]|nr:ATP-binding cassette domain-containing protein [Anaeromyxobacteraceae bacterium]